MVCLVEERYSEGMRTTEPTEGTKKDGKKSVKKRRKDEQEPEEEEEEEVRVAH